MPDEKPVCAEEQTPSYFLPRHEFLTSMDAHRTALEMAVRNLEKATEKAANAMEHRLGQMNEIRGAMTDQAVSMIRREEYVVQHKALEDRIEAVRTSLTERIDANTVLLNTIVAKNSGGREEKDSSRANWLLIASMVMMIVAVTSSVLMHWPLK